MPRARPVALVHRALLLLVAASCRRSPPPPRPLQRDTIPRESTLSWNATVTRASGLPLAVGARCRFEARVGHDLTHGALDLLFHGRCGAVEVYAPTDEDLGTGAQLETGQRGCTLTPLAADGGAARYAVRCPSPAGPPGSRSHRLVVEGAAARVQRRWSPAASIDLAWEPASDAVIAGAPPP